MKKYSLPAFLFIVTLNAHAWTRLATCNSGDAIAGVEVYTDGKDVILQVLSQEDGQPADEFRTNLGKVNPEPVDVPAIMNSLNAGKTVTLTLSQPESFSFGGETTHAALLNFKLNQPTSYERTSQLAYGSSVLALHCNQPE